MSPDDQSKTDVTKPEEIPVKSEELTLDELDIVSGGSDSNHVHWTEWSKWQ